MKKILIVEDDKDFLWILKEGFSKENFNMFFATDGEEGLSTALVEKPDLMLVDIQLPKMDGIAMVKAINEKGLKCQKIFLTNFKDNDHISQAMEALGGNTDYIIKSDTHVADIVKHVKKKLGIA